MLKINELANWDPVFFHQILISRLSFAYYYHILIIRYMFLFKSAILTVIYVNDIFLNPHQL